MIRPVSPTQKAAGLFAALAAAAMISTPLLAGINGVFEKQKLVTDRRAAIHALEARIEADRSGMRLDVRGYTRVRQSLDPETVAIQLGALCAAFAEQAPALSVRQNCTSMQAPLGGGLLQHGATLGVSGSPSDLLQALDEFSQAGASLDQLRLTADPADANEAMLSLRFIDMSEMPADMPP
jgi:class 3 adenylate cyclase